MSRADDGWIDGPLLTENMVAHLLQAPNARTVARLRRAGRLPGVRVGRGYRYDRADVRAYIDRERAEAAS